MANTTNKTTVPYVVVISRNTNDRGTFHDIQIQIDINGSRFSINPRDLYEKDEKELLNIFKNVSKVVKEENDNRTDVDGNKAIAM